MEALNDGEPAVAAWEKTGRKWIGRLLILLLAVVLRVALLDLRPPHFDEGVNGYIADQISWEHLYRYHPEVGHGPLFFYLVHAGEAVCGHNLWGLRLPAVIFSLLSVWLCFRFDSMIGRRGADLAAFIMALSPSLTFVGRTAIGESTLAFFLLLMLWGAMGLTVRKTFLARCALVFGATGALAVKEVAVVHFAALLVAALAVAVGFPWDERLSTARRRHWLALGQYAGLVSAAGLALWLLYTAGGRYPDALGRWWRGVESWRHIGQLEHAKPWHYWLGLLARDEPMLLLAALLLLWLAWQGGRTARFCACYSLAVLGAYSAISYKTPWCLASLAASLPIAAGIAVAHAGKTARIVGGGLAVVLLPLSLWSNLRLNLWAHSDPREAQVYVATSPEIGVLLRTLQRHAAVVPRGGEIRGKVFAAEPHPLPWLLRDYPCIGYFQTDARPESYDSGFVVADAYRLAEIEPHLEARNYERLLLHWRVDQPPGAVFLQRQVFRERAAD